MRKLKKNSPHNCTFTFFLRIFSGSFTEVEGQRLGVTENGLLRRIFEQVLSSCECSNLASLEVFKEQ